MYSHSFSAELPLQKFLLSSLSENTMAPSTFWDFYITYPRGRFTDKHMCATGFCMRSSLWPGRLFLRSCGCPGIFPCRQHRCQGHRYSVRKISRMRRCATDVCWVPKTRQRPSALLHMCQNQYIGGLNFLWISTSIFRPPACFKWACID